MSKTTYLPYCFTCTTLTHDPTNTICNSCGNKLYKQCTNRPHIKCADEYDWKSHKMTKRNATCNGCLN